MRVQLPYGESGLCLNTQIKGAKRFIYRSNELDLWLKQCIFFNRWIFFSIQSKMLISLRVNCCIYANFVWRPVLCHNAKSLYEHENDGGSWWFSHWLSKSRVRFSAAPDTFVRALSLIICFILYHIELIKWCSVMI